MIEQACNSLAARQLFSFPVLPRATHLVRQAVVALEQGQQGDMWVALDQGRPCLIAAAGLMGRPSGVDAEDAGAVVWI